MRRILSASTALAALAACGGGAPQPQPGNAASGSVVGALTSPDGRSEVRGDAGFSGLPAGIPAYPNVRGGALQMGGADDGAEMRVMAFRTADAPAQVITFYAEAGTAAGFRIVHRADAGPSVALGLARDNGEGLNVTATGTPGGTSVQIMTGRPAAPR